MTSPEPSFDDLMRPSYEELGLDGSPFALPAFLRRICAKVAALHPRIFATIVWLFHKTWGCFARRQKHETVRKWGELAKEYSFRQGLNLGRRIAALDQYPTFRNGCRRLGFRNCLDACFYRGSYLDAFFRQGRWTTTEFSHDQQRPSYFIPGIPAHRFYDPDQFEWKDLLEQAFRGIQAELLTLLQGHTDEFGTFHTEFGHSIGGWNTLIFYVNGRRQNDNCVLSPRGAEIADAMIEFEEGELTMYSSLNPHARIPPHVGPLNGILRGHLPLLVPKGCGLQVGGETVEWEEGKILVFDDSFVHNVWNDSDQVRIVLFFNIWHPCLSPDERHALAALRRAYNDTPTGRYWLKQQEAQRVSTVKTTEPAAT